MTICHVNVSKWGNLPSRGQKAQKRDMNVLKICTFLSRFMAEITRNRNGHTGSINVHISEYLALFIDHIWFTSRNQTPRNTTRDAFMNRHVCARINLSSFTRCELGKPLLKLLNCKRNNNLKKPHLSTPGL